VVFAEIIVDKEAQIHLMFWKEFDLFFEVKKP